MRTPDEIVARVLELAPVDPFGWTRELLAAHLPADRLIEAGFIAGDPATYQPQGLDQASLLAAMADYLDFAWTKALDHRGISAGRSVDKLEQWLWLLGNDEALERFVLAPYPPYGAPKLAEVSALLERPIPPGEKAARMAAGLACREDGCFDGCES